MDDVIAGQRRSERQIQTPSNGLDRNSPKYGPLDTKTRIHDSCHTYKTVVCICTPLTGISENETHTQKNEILSIYRSVVPLTYTIETHLSEPKHRETHTR
jgi:hypothetical protein